jgi:predicted transcriptional regulator
LIKVLLSIKPEFASRIFNGSKKYEYRRIIFKRRDVETIVVYASDPIKRVIGEFDIGEILHRKPDQLWTQTCNHAGITRARFMDYFGNREKGYAIEVRKTRKYRSPLSLNDLKLSYPPQSFMYLHTDPMYYFYAPVQSSLSNPVTLQALALG